MRKHVIFSLILTLCVLFSCAACQSPTPTEESIPTTKVELEIVYKSNQLCYAVMHQGDDICLYQFNAAAQPITDIEGHPATAVDLLPGMIVSVEYDGYILETYPAQFSGVSGIHVIGKYANSVEFLGSMISAMFPSTSPEDVERWEIAFSGDEFLSPKEKRALEFLMGEEWLGARVSVEPEQSYTKKTGHIVVNAEKGEGESYKITISVDTGLPDQEPIERSMNVTLTDGQWTR